MLRKNSIPGFKDGGMKVEPTSGNDVPPGALPKEVADDVDAKLSEGEFVLPADVVRYIGLEKLMKLRDKAKEGLKRMEEIGQVGNADEVPNPEAAFSEAGIDMEDEDDDGRFESDIDEILGELEPDDDVKEQTEMAFADGGVVPTTFKGGSDLTKATKNPAVDVRYFTHPDGRTIFVTFVNGKPMMPIPQGFKPTDSPVEQQVGKEAEAEQEATGTEGTGVTGSVTGADRGGSQNGNVSGGYTPRDTGPLEGLKEASVIGKVAVPAANIALGPLAGAVARAATGYGTAEAAKGVQTALSAYGGEPADINSAKVAAKAVFGVKDPGLASYQALSKAFDDNTGLMGGYMSVGVDPAINSIANSMIGNAEAKDMTPAQVGAIGLSITSLRDSIVAEGTSLPEATEQAALAHGLSKEQAAAARAAAEGGSGGGGPSVAGTGLKGTVGTGTSLSAPTGTGLGLKGNVSDFGGFGTDGVGSDGVGGGVSNGGLNSGGDSNPGRNWNKGGLVSKPSKPKKTKPKGIAAPKK